MTSVPWKKKHKRETNLSRTQALDCTPVKNTYVQVTRLDTGEVLLTYPATMRPWISGLIRRFGRPSEGDMTRKLQLDELGTTVWDLLDGEKTVRNIVVQFAEQYKLQHREAEVSVTQFLHSLGKRGLIGMGS